MTTAALPTRKKVIDSDTELVQAITAGRTDRFGELVKRYEQKLYSFSRRMCREEADAQDLVQETFLSAFRYLNEFRHETRFKNWLYRIAASACIRKHRKSKFAPDREVSLDDFESGELAEFSDQVPEWARAPLDQLLNEELLAMLNDAIHALPEKYRLVIVLRDIEGFSTEEAAQILGLSPANIKVRLHRGRLFLRDRLKGYFEHGV